MRSILTSMIMITALFFGSFMTIDEKPVYIGYTEDGVYFEVYEVATARQQDVIKDKSDSKRVEIKIIYEGKVDPPRQYYYSKEFGKVLYSGNLALRRVNYYEGKTEAIYSGNIFKS